MRRLYQEFGETGVGYTEADYLRLVNEVAGRNMQAYFDKFIYGTEPLLATLDRVLHTVGCQLLAVPNPAHAEATFGFRTTSRADRTDVVYIWPGSPAERALSVEDEIVAVNGCREAPNALLLLPGAAPHYELTVLRQNRLLTVQLNAGPGRTFGPRYEVRRLPTADAAQQQGFRQWLGWEF